MGEDRTGDFLLIVPSGRLTWRGVVSLACCAAVIARTFAADADTIRLPAPRLTSSIALEQAISQRHSVREFSGDGVNLRMISQLLWACQGATLDGRRTAPSAGGLYPLVICLVAQRTVELSPGAYCYLPQVEGGGAALVLLKSGELLPALSSAAGGQECVRDCAGCLIITAEVGRTAAKYGSRAERYVLIEVGHAAQNVLLQATALGLGAVPVGAFEQIRVKDLLGNSETPFYLMPFGVPDLKR